MKSLFSINELPHLKLERLIPSNRRYKRPGRGKPLPSKPKPDHGLQLLNQIEMMRDSLKEELEIIPPDFNPDLIIKVDLSCDVELEKWKKSNLEVLAEEIDGSVVLFSSDQLAELQKRVEIYRDAESTGSRIKHNWIAAIDNMSRWNASNRMGRKLKNMDLTTNADLLLDIQLWSYGTEDQRDERIRFFSSFVLSHGGVVTDKHNSDHCLLLRVKISTLKVTILLENDYVYKIDIPPNPLKELPSAFSTRIDSFSTPTDSPREDAPSICIVDSGIAIGHPLLQQAVGEVLSFPRSLGDGTDDCGHGTMVAGIAMYGDVQKCINELNFYPKFTLHGAKVTNKDGNFDDKQLIVNQITDAIVYFKNEYGCRIFNLSLGDGDAIFSDDRPSEWAEVLDTLASNLDILIVVSGGNSRTYLDYDSPTHVELYKDYPNYLFDQKSRILEPSSAVNVLTVGSICGHPSSYFAGKNEKDLKIPIGEKDQPSPFTTCGPGPGGFVKPEVVEFGGSITWDSLTGIIKNDPGLSVISTNMNFHERLFSVGIGTSYSTPKITNLAAEILNEYPDATANLIRALIISSAEIPQSAIDQFGNDNERLKILYGYGIPSKDKALFSSENRVLLISQEKIGLDRVHIYRIPNINEFSQSRGARSIKVALAFDPPVRRSRKDYIGFAMSFKLIRGTDIDTITEWFSSARKKDGDPVPESHKFTLIPGIQKRIGTTQIGVFTAKSNRAFDKYIDEDFYLVVESSNIFLSEQEEQEFRYSVVLTMEHSDPLVNLYTPLRNQLQIQSRLSGRVRTRF